MGLRDNKESKFIELPKDNDNSKLFYKVELNDTYKKDAKITVPPTHTVLFIKDGKIHAVLEEGIHNLYEKTGGFWVFKHNVKDYHSAYALFVSKTARTPVYWGTDANHKINYIDPMLGYPIDLYAFGEIEIRVKDAKKFYLEIVASSGDDTVNDSAEKEINKLKAEVEEYQKRKSLKQNFSKEDNYDLNKKLEELMKLEQNSSNIYSTEKLENRFRPKAVSIIAEKIKETIIEKNVSYFELDEHKSEIQKNIFGILKESFSTDYGIELCDLLIAGFIIEAEEYDTIKQIYKDKQSKINERNEYEEDRAFQQKRLADQEEDTKRALNFKNSIIDVENAIYDRQKEKEREEIEYQLKIKREEEDRAWLREREEKERQKEIELSKMYHDSVKTMGWEHSPINKTLEKTKMFCTKCGAEIDKDDLFCSSCGSPSKPEIIKDVCPKCGREINMKMLFCPSCGQKILQDGKVTTITVVEKKPKGTKKK